MTRRRLSAAAAASDSGALAPGRVPSTMSGARCATWPARCAAPVRRQPRQAPCTALGQRPQERSSLPARHRRSLPARPTAAPDHRGPAPRGADPIRHLGADPGGGLDGPPGGDNLHVIRTRTARVLHVHHRAVANEPRIQLVGQVVTAEFHIEIPQHLGLGKGERTVRRVRSRPEQFSWQSEQCLEGAHQPAAVPVVDHDDGHPLRTDHPGPAYSPFSTRKGR
jgi:hypothetical protein